MTTEQLLEELKMIEARLSAEGNKNDNKNGDSNFEPEG